MGGFQYLPTAQLRMRFTGYDLHDFGNIYNITGYAGKYLKYSCVSFFTMSQL